MLELDELWSFVGYRINVRWVGIVLCLQPRQLIAFFVDDSLVEKARALRGRIPPDYRCRFNRSDCWLAYEEAFPERTHRLCDKAEGKPIQSSVGFARCPGA